MKIALGTITVSDEERRAFAMGVDEKKLATRAEIRDFIIEYGRTAFLDRCDDGRRYLRALEKEAEEQAATSFTCHDCEKTFKGKPKLRVGVFNKYPVCAKCTDERGVHGIK